MTTHDTTHIPEWWRETTLGEVVKIQPGFAFKSWDFSSNSWFSVIKIKNIQPPFIKLESDDLVVIDSYSKDKLSKFEVRNWDYLIAMTGETIGKVGKYNLGNFAYINQRVCKVIKSEKSDYRFIYYSLLQDGFQKFINTHSFGAAQANISTDQIGFYKILLPPLPEQRAIADILSSLDAKIELLREQNETLEKTAQTIFQEWFGRYSVESPEELPQGWRVGKLGEVADIKWGKRLSQWDNLVGYKTDHPYIRITDLTWNWIKKENLQYIEDQVFSKISRYIVNNGDIILSIVGSIGSVARIDDELDNANLTENCVKFVNLKNIGSNYLFNFLISELWQGEIIRNTVWAVQKKLPIYGIQNMEILIPTKDIIQRFEEIVGEFSIKIFSNNSQIQSLSKNRDTILPKLMGGEVNIND